MFPNRSDIDAISDITGIKLSGNDFKPMSSSGLTHEHILIADSNWILRIPRRNQLEMSAQDYLQHQKACYDVASVSGVTPSCLGIVNPSDNLPNGALVVQKITGRRVESVNDLPAVAKCLAAMSKVQPIKNDWVQKVKKPYDSACDVIDNVFGEFFNSKAVDKNVRDYLNKERINLSNDIKDQFNAKSFPLGMIGGDSHLGNYMIDNQGKAWFVDLEFLTFDIPTLDTADAILNVTCKLVPENEFDISVKDRKDFYNVYLDDVTEVEKLVSTIELSERLITMRSLAWMCYWVDKGRIENNPEEKVIENFNKICANNLTIEGASDLLNFSKNNPINVNQNKNKPTKIFTIM